MNKNKTVFDHTSAFTTSRANAKRERERDADVGAGWEDGPLGVRAPCHSRSLLLLLYVHVPGQRVYCVWCYPDLL